VPGGLAVAVAPLADVGPDGPVPGLCKPPGLCSSVVLGTELSAGLGLPDGLGLPVSVGVGEELGDGGDDVLWLGAGEALGDVPWLGATVGVQLPAGLGETLGLGGIGAGVGPAPWSGQKGMNGAGATILCPLPLTAPPPGWPAAPWLVLLPIIELGAWMCCWSTLIASAPDPMITAKAASAAAGRSHAGRELAAPLGLNQATAWPAQPSAGPIRLDSGPIRSNTGPIRPNTGPIRPNTGLMRPNTGLMRSSAGPTRPDTGVIRSRNQVSTGLNRSAAGSVPDIIQAVTVGRGDVSRARIRSRPSPAGSTESAAARSAWRSSSSCSRVGYVMDSAPGLP
jgi:hypothetical protein